MEQAPRRRLPSRRTFLGLAGLAGGALLLPRLRHGHAARAAGVPRRVVFMMTELGWNPFEFRMKPPGAPEALLLASGYHPQYWRTPDEASWDIPLGALAEGELSPTLRPLHGMRDRVLALDGLGLLSAAADRWGDGHAKGWNAALTGHPASAYLTSQRAIGGAPSLDQRIARHLRQTTPHLTDLVSLNFEISHHYHESAVGFHHYFWQRTEQGEMVPVELTSNPNHIHQRLYPEGGDDAISRGQRDVLRLATERYASMRPHLGTDDRNKLAQHTDLLRDIQARHERLAEAQCAPPGLRPLDDSMSRAQRYHENAELFFDMITASFACDTTRVVGVQMSNSVAKDVFGAGDFDFHEWYSHGTNPPKRWIGVDGADVSQVEHDKFLDAAPVLASKNRHHVEMAVRLAEKLDAVPEGDGTLLDRTLIVLMDEISHGSHGHDQWPVILLGGFGGAFRMGRYVRLPRTNPNPGINGMPFVGVPHSHLLISIAREMGMDLDDLGIESVYGYAGSESSDSGKRISLTGGLDRLYG